MVYKCIHGLAPSYLASHCEPTSSCPVRSHLRSSKSGQLNFPRTKTDYGKRSFAVNGPVVWNSLPTELQSPDISLDVFKAKLKTFLFNCWLSTFGVFILILRFTNVLNNNNNAPQAVFMPDAPSSLKPLCLGLGTGSEYASLHILRLSFYPWTWTEVLISCRCYCHLLQEYSKNPSQNWKSKDAAIFLVTSLAAKAQTQKVSSCCYCFCFINLFTYLLTFLLTVVKLNFIFFVRCLCLHQFWWRSRRLFVSWTIFSASLLNASVDPTHYSVLWALSLPLFNEVTIILTEGFNNRTSATSDTVIMKLNITIHDMFITLTV